MNFGSHDEGILAKIRLKNKNVSAFLNDSERFDAILKEAYELDKKAGTWSNRDFSYHQKAHEKIADALVLFVDSTQWLLDKQSSKKMKEESFDAEVYEKWIETCKKLLNALWQVTGTYTNYRNSLGMSNGDENIASIFREARRQVPQNSEYIKDPAFIHFSDDFRKAALLLFDNGQIELARRFALISAIEDIWDTEWRDAIDGLTAIYFRYYWAKNYDRAVPELIKVLRWLYAAYSEWKEQERTDLQIDELQSYLVSDWDIVNEQLRTLILNFWEQTINRKPELSNDEFIFSRVIDRLVQRREYDKAFKLVEKRIRIISEESGHQENFRTLAKMAKLGFSLKDHDLSAVLRSNNELKASYLENRVSELAKCMGFLELGDRLWDYKNPDLSTFMGKTKTVEVDVNRYKLEYCSGKERKVFFLAECKWRNKPTTVKDLVFFQAKVIDFFQQQRIQNANYPKKLASQMGAIWFVSIGGFAPDVLKRRFDIGNSCVELISRQELNELLERNGQQAQF